MASSRRLKLYRTCDYVMPSQRLRTLAGIATIALRDRNSPHFGQLMRLGCSKMTLTGSLPLIVAAKFLFADTCKMAHRSIKAHLANCESGDLKVKELPEVRCQ